MSVLLFTLPPIPDLPKPDFNKYETYQVVRIVDGDTIKIKQNGKDVTVRLIGVDTSETVHPSKPVEAYGKEASYFTRNLLKGESVYIVPDTQSGKQDRYGRVLGYVYRAPDGLFVNAEIIRQGYGHAYTKFPFDYLEQFRQLEKFAREAGKGLWTDKKPVQSVSQLLGVTVYVTANGGKYHKKDCSYLKGKGVAKALNDVVETHKPCSRCYK
ncbi:MAG: thermonuclease family protein [Planctomycetes bacterium]|nr:thermonuclease family protein [Planctomycetota bacterium]